MEDKEVWYVKITMPDPDTRIFPYNLYVSKDPDDFYMKLVDVYKYKWAARRGALKYVKKQKKKKNATETYTIEV